MNSAAEIWSRVLKLMESDLTPITISTWFEDAEPVELDHDRFYLCVPVDFKRDIISKRYVVNIKKALRELFSADLEVVILAPQEKDKMMTPQEDTFLPDTEEYTFDRFVVGSSNKFAYAAALAVAKEPGKPKGYNPLFIYGDSGLGKTHLLYSIAHTIHANYPTYNIVYIKGDTFTNELITAIREGKNEEFRQKYREADVFLMDDVQFIAGRESSQEEMFHTFNTLYENKKQIVFTADRPPKEMIRLDDRLRTRFEWGLSADIVPPDYETRVAIIKNKAIRRGMNLPDAVLQYVAENITANVRQIEGTVNKLVAFQEMMGEQVDVNMVHRAIKDMFIERSTFLPSPDLIIEETAKFYNLTSQEIMGRSKTKNVVLARQVAMFVTKKMTTLSLEDIGAAFNRDHTTVMHAVGRITDLMNKSPDMKEIVSDITSNVNARFE